MQRGQTGTDLAQREDPVTEGTGDWTESEERDPQKPKEAQEQEREGEKRPDP